MLRWILREKSNIYLSDVCRMGGFFIRGKLVEYKLLSRKYEGLVFFEHRLYHVYIRYGFYTGAQITGIAVPFYPDIKTAFDAGSDLSRAYRKSFRADKNSVHTGRKVKNICSFIVQLIALAAILLYVEQLCVVAAEGLNTISVMLGILYPLIVALCYYTRSKCQ